VELMVLEEQESPEAYSLMSQAMVADQQGLGEGCCFDLPSNCTLRG